MKWKQGRRSSNVEDRRGQGMSRGVRVGGLGGIGLLVVVVIALFMGVDPVKLLQDMPVSQAPSASVQPGPQASAAEDEAADFVAVVLADTEDTWSSIFSQLGKNYEEPVLVLFRDRVQSACGTASAATGPFYCPADHKLYIDLSFFDELHTRFRAPGDFAQAYVIAHEVGHHVQTLLGISQEISSRQRALSEAGANELSVRLELQADCFSGVWANQAQRSRAILEPGDLEEALGAASAVGDDRIQKQARGYVVPDSFTHGTSEQRARWFRRGFDTGDVRQCDTFDADRL